MAPNRAACSPDAARYAIYFAPRRESAWWTFGCAWLGRDPITNAGMAHPALAALDAARLAHITSAPRRYGFHATLKPPFRLATGHLPKHPYLQAANLAAALKALPLPTLQLAEIDGFIALSFAADSEGVRNCNAIVIDHHLKLGKTVVVNGSRAHLVTALSRYPAMTVALITLPREVAQARQTTRARRCGRHRGEAGARTGHRGASHATGHHRQQRPA